MTDILDRLFDRSYDLEETLHDAHTEIVKLRAAIRRHQTETRAIFDPDFVGTEADRALWADDD